MSEINEKLIQYINKLSDLTFEGKIPWYKTNPTVYTWDSFTPLKQTRITLQEARSRIRISAMQVVEKKTYLFQVQDLKDKTGNVSVDSKERTDYQKPLEKLFQAAGQSIDARAAALLGDLLEDLEN